MASTIPDRQQAKLRKSCDVCATTKVGCSKEKPTCSRCAKRGLVCSYSTAKRAGRSAKTAVQTDATFSDQPSPLFETVDPFCNNLSTALTFGTDMQNASFYTGTESSEKIFLPDPEDSGMLPSLSHDLSDLDEFLASMTGHPFDTFLDGKGSSTKYLDTTKTVSLTSCSSRGSRSSSLFMSSSSTSDDASNSPLVRASLTADLILKEFSIDVDCNCFAQAASLSSRFSSHLSDSQLDDSDGFHDFQTALCQTQQHIDHVRTILQCSCSDDGDLIVALLLVLLKAITWYTSAAQLVSIKMANRETRVLQHTHAHMEDRHRLAAQSILSKLVDVQMLIETLSQRLQKVLGDDEENGLESFRGKGDRGSMPLVSTELAYALHTDLGKRLHSLSQAIIERLQQV